MKAVDIMHIFYPNLIAIIFLGKKIAMIHYYIYKCKMCYYKYNSLMITI